MTAIYGTSNGPWAMLPDHPFKMKVISVAVVLELDRKTSNEEKTGIRSSYCPGRNISVLAPSALPFPSEKMFPSAVRPPAPKVTPDGRRNSMDAR